MEPSANGETARESESGSDATLSLTAEWKTSKLQRSETTSVALSSQPASEGFLELSRGQVCIELVGNKALTLWLLVLLGQGQANFFTHWPQWVLKIDRPGADGWSVLVTHIIWEQKIYNGKCTKHVL